MLPGIVFSGGLLDLEVGVRAFVGSKLLGGVIVLKLPGLVRLVDAAVLH